MHNVRVGINYLLILRFVHTLNIILKQVQPTDLVSIDGLRLVLLTWNHDGGILTRQPTKECRNTHNSAKLWVSDPKLRNLI